MASVQYTVGTTTPVTIPSVTGRIVATMMSAPSEAWITTDGSTPVAPSGTILNTAQKTIAGVIGQQVVLFPIPPGSGPGGGSVLPIVTIGSSGTPVIELEW